MPLEYLIQVISCDVSVSKVCHFADIHIVFLWFLSADTYPAMPGFRWDLKQDIALATMVLPKRPHKLVGWSDVAEDLNASFSTEDKPVHLKGRGCRERMDLLLKKCKDDDKVCRCTHEHKMCVLGFNKNVYYSSTLNSLHTAGQITGSNSNNYLA